MAWNTLSLTDKAPGFPGRWYAIALPAASGLLSYGFRLVGTGPLPLTWQIAGYWAVLYTCDSKSCSTASHPFLAFSVGVEQPIRVLGASEVEYAPGNISGFKLLVSPNDWVPFTGIELLGLFP